MSVKDSAVPGSDKSNPDIKLRGRDVLVSYTKRRFLNAIVAGYLKLGFVIPCRGRGNLGLKLDYCLFAIEELQNPLAALAMLKEVEKSEPTIMDKFLAFRYEKLIKGIKLAKDDKDSAQQMMNIQQQTFIEDFEEMLIDTTQKYIILWEMLEDESPKYGRLVQNCFALLEQLEEVERFYAVIHKSRLKNYRIYMLYSSFLSDIIHEPTKGKKIMTMYVFACLILY